METRVLGRGGLEVSAVGMGCMGLSHAYGEAVDKKLAASLIAKAVDEGITLFDTAEVYGTPRDPHHNEKIVGRALAPFRGRVKIVTKFGLSFDFKSGKVPLPLIPDSRPETIRRSVEGSLQRLGTDHIDLYFQHRQDPKIPVEEVAGVMGDLIREGKILHWGLSQAGEETLRKAHAVTPVAALENRYSMMARGFEELFPVLEELGVGFVAYSPLANGLLSGAYGRDASFDPKTDYRAKMPQFRPEAFDENRELLALLRSVAERTGSTPAQVSLAWMLAKRPWIVPIPGMRKAERITENAGAAALKLSPEAVAAIDRALGDMDMSGVFGVAKN